MSGTRRYTLDIISAGRLGRTYATVLSGLNWDNFYHRLGGGLLFAAMRDDMRRNYDYALIDSRTGRIGSAAKEFQAFLNSSTGISNLTADQHTTAASNQAYDLSGRPLAPTQQHKGIILKQGKKYIKK